MHSKSQAGSNEQTDFEHSEALSYLQKDARLQVKLIDFGIAKNLDSFDSGRLTRRGSWVGNPIYMSPEQSAGKPLTVQTDMYSLGCIMFQCLAGKPPYRGTTTIDTISLHQGAPIPSIREANPEVDMPPGFEQIIRKKLAKEPKDRYANMSEVQSELESLLGIDSHLFEQEPIRHTDSAPNTMAAVNKYSTAGRTKTIAIAAAILIPFIVLAWFTLGRWLLPDPASTAMQETSKEPANLAVLANIKNSIKNGKTTISFEGTNVTDDQLSFLSYESSIEKLDLSGTKITDGCFKYLSGLRLTRLKLKNTSIKDLTNLPCKSTLRCLDLSGTLVDDKSLMALKDCKKLEYLFVSNTRATVPGIIRLGPYLDLTDLRIKEPDPEFIFNLKSAFPFCYINKHQPITNDFVLQCNKLIEAGRGKEAYEKCQQREEIARAKHDARLQLFYLTGMSICLDSIGKKAEADRSWKQAMAFGEAHDLPLELERTYRMFLSRSVEQNHLDEAVATAQKAFDNFEKVSDEPLQTADYIGTLSALIAAHGRPKDGIRFIERSLEIIKQQPDSPIMSSDLSDSDPWASTVRSKQISYARALRRLGCAQIYDKQYKDAQSNIEKASLTLKQLDHILTIPDLINTKLASARLDYAKGNYKSALATNDECLKMMDETPAVQEFCMVETLEQRLKLLKIFGRTREEKIVEREYKRITADSNPTTVDQEAKQAK